MKVYVSTINLVSSCSTDHEVSMRFWPCRHDCGAPARKCDHRPYVTFIKLMLQLGHASCNWGVASAMQLPNDNHVTTALPLSCPMATDVHFLTVSLGAVLMCYNMTCSFIHICFPHYGM